MKLGWKNGDITDAFTKSYEENITNKPAVYIWLTHFKKEQDGVEDEAHRGRLSTSI